MTKATIQTTLVYSKSLETIEDYIYATNDNDVSAVEKFLDEHETVMKFIAENSNTPAPHLYTGDQSWPFGNGRYRLFYKVKNESDSITVYLLDIIDNRMMNLDFYPNNSLPTYSED